MIQCPDCRQMIPDDSAFCDQCGKELKWCPECRRPKRGTECPVCGSDLIPGRKYLSGDHSKPSSVTPGPDRVSPAALVGNGWRLTLQEGPFGRRGGIWPELSSCPYVSGNHGKILKSGADWLIEDSGSTNGTYVNGARIQRQALKKGDRVRIATLDFTVE
ncbi:MAG: FHA domain-containing protein [Bacteroidales bacterium]|nr:FHA domain-containing protein [Bacteroidales bacterium]